jgi:nucleotide-binding universal stress UspA family protein
MMHFGKADSLCILTVSDPEVAESSALVARHDDLMNILDRFSKQIDYKIAWESKNILGESRSSICGFAKEWDATYVLVGARGQGKLPTSDLRVGSTASYVVENCHCSVVVVKMEQ